jgi:hypothetical protein
MFSKQILIAATAVLSASAIFAAGHFDDKVRADFFAGIAGDSAALQRGMAAAEDAIANDPHFAAEAKSWHGTGLLVLSGQQFKQGNIIAGTELWMRANKEMEEAGQMEPDNPAVLIPRAAAWFTASRTAPALMAAPVLKQAVADYQHVYDMQRGYFDRLSMHMRSQLLFGLADGYARTGDTAKARDFFGKLDALGPESGHQQQAQSYLKGEQYTVPGAGCVGCHTSK